MLHAGRKQLLKYLLFALLPFIAISLAINVYFYNTQYQSTVSIVQSVTQQASGQLASLYKMAAGIAQNIVNGAVVQDELLVDKTDKDDYQLLNRNILKLQSLVKTYLFFDEITAIRFYLPDDMIIADGSMLLYDDQRSDTAWYQEYLAHAALRRWYVTDEAQDANGGNYVSVVADIRNPLNFRNTVGSLRVDFQRSYIESIMAGGTIYESTDSFLLDAQGDTVLHLGALSPAFPIQAMGGSLDISGWPEYAVLDGAKYLVVSRALTSSSMYLVNLVPVSSIRSNNLVNYTFQIILMLVEIQIVIMLTAMLAYSAISSRNNRLKLLNQQINPHFLYNALDMINWKAINSNMPDICRPIQKLSRFYKMTLNHGLDYITLKEEFEQLALYLEIQDSRFGNKITYTCTLDPALNDCYVLHMVLQPIVENAILHGILEQDGAGGDIQISARQVDEDILVTVRDSGVGMDEETVRKVLRGNESKGYGLSSVSERMRLYYKRRYGMKIRSAVGEGTTVEVLFPVSRTDPSKR